MQRPRAGGFAQYGDEEAKLKLRFPRKEAENVCLDSAIVSKRDNWSGLAEQSDQLSARDDASRWLRPHVCVTPVGAYTDTQATIKGPQPYETGYDLSERRVPRVQLLPL